MTTVAQAIQDSNRDAIAKSIDRAKEISFEHDVFTTAGQLLEDVNNKLGAVRTAIEAKDEDSLSEALSKSKQYKAFDKDLVKEGNDLLATLRTQSGLLGALKGAIDACDKAQLEDAKQKLDVRTPSLNPPPWLAASLYHCLSSPSTCVSFLTYVP